MDAWTYEHAETIQAQAFWLPKGGASEEEYEDAFAVSGEEPRATDAPLRFAVADGATETLFARRWARLLTGAFIEHGAAALTDQLPALQEQWAAAIDAQADALPWYATEKAAAGAFAAVLGLTLRPPAAGREGRWQAVSVGDGNLFHLHGGQLVRAWPQGQPDDFGNRPALVPSRPDREAPAARRAEGSFRHSDTFLLATDAAAAWLLRTDPAEALHWEGQDAFAEAAADARREGTLHNDDVTVLVLRMD